jgi:hypothetical protein
VQADARKASERARHQQNALRQRPMNRPLVSKAKPASIIMSRVANILYVFYFGMQKRKNFGVRTSSHKLRTLKE